MQTNPAIGLNASVCYRSPISYDSDDEEHITTFLLPLYSPTKYSKFVRRRHLPEVAQLTRGIRNLYITEDSSTQYRQRLTPRRRTVETFWDLIDRASLKKPLESETCDDVSDKSAIFTDHNASVSSHTEISPPLPPTQPLNTSAEHIHDKLPLLRLKISVPATSSAPNQVIPEDAKILDEDLSIAKDNEILVPDVDMSLCTSPVAGTLGASVSPSPKHISSQSTKTHAIPEIDLAGSVSTETAPVLVELVNQAEDAMDLSTLIGPQTDTVIHTGSNMESDTQQDSMDDIRVSSPSNEIYLPGPAILEVGKDEDMAEAPQGQLNDFLPHPACDNTQSIVGANTTSSVAEEENVREENTTEENSTEENTTEENTTEENTRAEMPVVNLTAVPQTCDISSKPFVSAEQSLPAPIPPDPKPVSSPGQIVPPINQPEVTPTTSTSTAPAHSKGKDYTHEDLVSLLTEAQKKAILKKDQVSLTLAEMFDVSLEKEEDLKTITNYFKLHPKFGRKTKGFNRAFDVVQRFLEDDRPWLSEYVVWVCKEALEANNLRVKDMQLSYINGNKRIEHIRKLLSWISKANFDLMIEVNGDGCLNWPEMVELAQDEERKFFDNQATRDKLPLYEAKMIDLFKFWSDKANMRKLVADRLAAQGMKAADHDTPSSPLGVVSIAHKRKNEEVKHGGKFPLHVLPLHQLSI